MDIKKGNQKCKVQRNWQHRIHRIKTKHNAICVGQYYTPANRNNVDETRALLQTTEGRDEPNIALMWES